MRARLLNFFKSKTLSAKEFYQSGNSFNRLGQWDAAVLKYDQAIALDAKFAEAYCNRGTALQQVGRHADALASYELAIALNPQDYIALYNSGLLLTTLKRFDDALASYDRCISLQPGYFEAHYNRANLMQAMKRHQDAVISYDHAIEINPAFAEAFQNRAYSLVQLRLFEAAVTSYDRALELNPEYASSFQGRLYALVSLGRFEAAIKIYDSLLAHDPSQRYLSGMRLHAKMQICEWQAWEPQLMQLVAGLQQDKLVSPPFPLLSAIDSLSVHRDAAKLWVGDQCPPDASLGKVSARPRSQKIRVGYFSADFRNHAVSQSAVELFETHDRTRFEIVAFAFGPESHDSMRARIERSFDRFIDVRDKTDREVAILAREIGIDIAVDLGGFTEYCRPCIFALRAAPLQVNYLGFPGTMGAPYMDYVIADRTVIPTDAIDAYQEKIVYLPYSYLPHDSTIEIPNKSLSRDELGLPSSGFVFCCFNKKYKITPEIFTAWMRILSGSDGSVLWLSTDNMTAVDNLRIEARRHGVDADRLIFAGRVESLAEHLARIRVAGLFLDTSPYNAHATAADALWAGLPVLTFSGSTFASRVSASLLKSIDMPELVANDIDAYVRIAIDLARDPERYGEWRRKLVRNRQTTPLFDTRRFAADLEAAYRSMYSRHLLGLPPDHIRVERERDDGA